jgi:hypothetical protein
LGGLLLAKEGISNIESNISICKTCHAYLTFNKIPKLAFTNALWIGGVAPTILQKLTMVEETLIAHYCYWMVLFKLCQHAFKGNV